MLLINNLRPPLPCICLGTSVEVVPLTRRDSAAGLMNPLIQITGELKMNRLKSTLCISVLTMIVSSTAFAGTIVGARASRTGTIVGARTGTIVGARTGNIAGTSTNTRVNDIQTRFGFDGLIYENLAAIFHLLLENPLL